jgi:hypothetical protein
MHLVLPPERDIERESYRLIGYHCKYPDKWIMIDSSKPRYIKGEEQYPEAKQLRDA